MECNDWQVWQNCNPEHIWIYDKLILSRKLGYTCGPIGVPVPVPGFYMLRPITNIPGMGRNATKVYIEQETEELAPGHFWCEVFEGRHFSCDYVKGQQVLCVEGFRDDLNNFYKWSRWERALHHIEMPTIIRPFAYQYPTINCEFIGDKLIEAHFRHNPDFVDGVDVMYPVWEGESTEPPNDMEYVASPDYLRLGFFVPKLHD